MSLDEQIESAASKAKSVTVDGQSVQRQSIPELIQADLHLAEKAAAKKKGPGIKFSQLRNRGTT
ncbi:hypothetical protein SH661x_001957 [Planctomicrobium sp. SH661]|uniref:hypothetical protein n=1 Tax=Planctomicrobium sp. SH661 TaxID=3448124 RepID=UPI003F5BA35C